MALRSKGRREREMAELRKLQKERKANEAVALERAATAHVVAEQTGQPFSYPGIGFGFSKAVFEAHLAALTNPHSEGEDTAKRAPPNVFRRRVRLKPKRSG